MKKLWKMAPLSVAMAAAARGTPAAAPVTSASAYRQQIEAWHQRRVQSLTSDTGWLTVAGLFWLKEGENSFGCDPQSAIVLPAGAAPARAGVFVHSGGHTTVRAAEGVPLRCAGRSIEQLAMRSDAEDSTDVVELNRLRFFVIKRGERYAIRMRDLNSPLRKEFTHIDRYDIDERYRVTAKFIPYDPPRHIPIASVIGTVDSMLAPGALEFQLEGKPQRLDAVLEEPAADALFLIFADATNGAETYGAGRFLYADLPHEGETVLDFNKAYNPPCAFTPFATCPLPPSQNRLPVAIRAGERSYGSH